MPLNPRPELGKSLVRFKIAAGCLVVAAILGFIAFRFQTRTHLITQRPVVSNQRFDRIWFDGRNRLVGARRERDLIRVQGVERSFDIPATDLVTGESSWAVSDDLETAAWITPRSVSFQRMDTGEVQSATVEKKPLSVSLLYDDTVAVTLSEGWVLRWSATSGEPMPAQRLDTGPITQAITSGDYLAVGGAEKVALYRYRAGYWTQTESEPAPPPPYRLAIPAPGSMAVIANGVLRTAGETRNTQGAVRSVVSHQGILIAAGEFKGAWAVTSNRQEEEDYTVAETSPGAELAAGSWRLAVSEPKGTTVFELGTEERLTAKGRIAAALAFLNALAALLLAIAPTLLRHLLKLFTRLLGGRGGGAGIGFAPATLPKPPTLLIERIAAARSVLWAGAGLSMQSGFAARAVFVANWVNTGIVDGWLSVADSDRLQRLMQTSGTEAVMNHLCATKPLQVNAFQIQSLIPRYSQHSRCHELLGSMPFAAAITTNYDDLLDRLQAHWTKMIVTPDSDEVRRLSGIPFLLKLYGHLPVPASVRLSRGKLAEGLPAAARQLLNAVGSLNTVFFVGASLEGLLADLDALGLSDVRGGTHFAVVGTASEHWKKLAHELKGRYSIEVLACHEDAIATELPEFLTQLQRAVQKTKPTAGQARELTETAA